MNLNFWNSINKQFIATFICLLIHLAWGVCQGFSAVLIPQLWEQDEEEKITNEQISWIASVSVVIMPIGSLFTGVLQELFGRKRIVQYSFIPLALGWAVISLADTVLMLCFGRMLTGLAVGADPAAITYIAEINIPKYRAMMLSIATPTVLVGTLLSYLIGHFLHWKHAALILSCFSLVCFLTFFFIPESPVWLVSKNKIKQATKSLKWLKSGNDEVQMELEELLNSKASQTNKDLENISYIQKIIATKAWKPFIIMNTYIILQMLVGNYIILYYAVNFYESFGMSIDSFVSSMVHVSLSMFSAIICSAIIEKYDRKTLTVISSFGLCICCFIAAIYTYFYEDVENKPVSWLPLACMCLYVVFGMIGIFTVPWIMTGELFPAQVRGFMTSLTWTMAYFYIFVTVKMYPIIVPYIKIYGILLMFSIFSLIMIFFGKFILPETRGKTLTEIENFW